jgi:hypothetical protein
MRRWVEGIFSSYWAKLFKFSSSDVMALSPVKAMPQLFLPLDPTLLTGLISLIFLLP